MKNENDNWVYKLLLLNQFILYRFFFLTVTLCINFFFAIVHAFFIQFFYRYCVPSDHFHLYPSPNMSLTPFSFTLFFFNFFSYLFFFLSSSFFQPSPFFLLPFPSLPPPFFYSSSSVGFFSSFHGLELVSFCF